MNSPYILAIDQGTTGTTALIFSRDQKVVSKGYREFTQIYPQPGWVEHNPKEIWSTTLECIRDALSNAGLSASDLEAIGVTNQRETTVLWDRKSGEPIYNAIVWQCRRTSSICRQLQKDGHEEFISERTGLLLDAYFSGTKISWILDRVPGAREKAKRGEICFGTIDTWLIWNLTGGATHSTDHTNASRTLLYDVHQKTWSDDLLSIFSVPRSILPEIQSSSSDFKHTHEDVLGTKIPILGVAGDQQSALYGHGAFEKGKCKCTYGTGAFALTYIGNTFLPSRHKLLTTIACDSEGNPAYAFEGSVFMAGAIVQWMRDSLGILSKASESESLAKAVPTNEGVYLVPAFVGLGAPHWNQDVRAAVLGMSRGSKKENIVRAGLEAIAYQVFDLLECIQMDLGQKLQSLSVDGGACENSFLMQFQADLLGIPVKKAEMMEMTAFGAARLAAKHLDLWESESNPSATHFEPSMSENERQTNLQGWKNAVQTVLRK